MVVWQWNCCGTVFVYPQSPHRDNDMIFWIFLLPFLTRFACDIGQSAKISIWVSPEVIKIICGIYWMIGRSTDYFITCYTVLTRPNKVETAAHGCNSWPVQFGLCHSCRFNFLRSISLASVFWTCMPCGKFDVLLGFVQILQDMKKIQCQFLLEK